MPVKKPQSAGNLAAAHLATDFFVFRVINEALCSEEAGMKTFKKAAIFGVVGLLVIVIIGSVAITRDGQLVTPAGRGQVELAAGTFEAFPLPDYAKPFVTQDYKSYFIEAAPGIKIHILETGTGYPLLLMHGNPTSGFLYRKVVAQLPLDRVRVIMPTLVGLGFSSKIPVSQHTLDNHMRWLNAALNQLQLNELVYVGQDWGGPIGMGALALSPDLLKGVVAMNTAFNAPKEKRNLSTAHATVKTPVIGEVLTGIIGSIFDTLPRVQKDPASMPADVLALYQRPLLDDGNEKAPLTLMRMVPDGPDHPSSAQMRQIETYVNSLNVPAEIVWGIHDPILGRGVNFMKANFPNARVTETEAGHFLQEEVPTEIAAAIMRVITQVQNR